MYTARIARYPRQNTLGNAFIYETTNDYRYIYVIFLNKIFVWAAEFVGGKLRPIITINNTCLIVYNAVL